MNNKQETRRADSFSGQQHDGQGVDGERVSVLPSASNDKASCAYGSERIDRAKRTIYRAEQWRSDNADAYRAIVKHAQALASRGETVSTRDYLHVVHSKAYLDRFGNDATVNADYCPVIARWLWREYPELRESIELRRCPVGEVMNV